MNHFFDFILRSIHKRQDQEKYHLYRKETDTHREKDCLLWPRQAWLEDHLKFSFVSFTIISEINPQTNIDVLKVKKRKRHTYIIVQNIYRRNCLCQNLRKDQDLSLTPRSQGNDSIVKLNQCSIKSRLYIV